MTTTTTRTLDAAFPARTRPRSQSLVATAAVGYSVAWLTGLAVPAPEFDLDAAPGAVLAGATAHGGLIAGRALLVLGVAAVALAIVAVALAGAIASGGERRLSRAALAAGLGAAVISAVQLVLELVVVGPVSSAHGAGGVLDAVNRLDGVKMVALAAFAAAGVAAASRGVLPRWLRALGVLLIAALAVSAAGYGLLLPGPALAAYVSLPLLLVWVTGAGLALARAARR